MEPMPERPPSLLTAAGNSFGVILASVSAFWTVEVVDSVALDDRLQRNGIRPRHLDGLDGVLWAPFLHGDFGHLLANTLPFIVLSALVLVHGRRLLLSVYAVVALLGGGLTWLFARSGNHIGASGVVFGLLGYLCGAAIWARNIRSVVTAIAAVALYGGLVWGFLPRPGISFEGHVFGFVAGVVAAAALHRSDDLAEA